MYKLNFGKGLDRMTFEMTENQLLSELGQPTNRESIDGTTYLYYDGLMVSINEDDKNTDYLSFFLEGLDLGNAKILAEITKEQEARTIIKGYHASNDIEFEEDIEDVDGERMFSYENAGLTFWVEDGVVTDVCVQEPGVE